MEVLQQGKWPSLKPNASQGLATYMRFDLQCLLQRPRISNLLGKSNAEA
jgi:hypothetical protein